ncbi:MAG: hypothetical protein FWC76_02650 [Defluviitaleaceae bacterium]|nr:hypothetical protein [Defluviitaleaceae bacterium]
MPAKHRKMLTDWQAPYIMPLLRLIETQSKTTIANWCIDYAEGRILPIYETAYPEDTRPKDAIAAARKWLSGEIKLPEAKKIILACHAAAGEAEEAPAAQAAARTIAQCASSIHAAAHCAALMFYGAVAVAYDTLGVNADWDKILEVAEIECGLMQAALQGVAIENEPNPAKINWNC